MLLQDPEERLCWWEVRRLGVDDLLVAFQAAPFPGGQAGQALSRRVVQQQVPVPAWPRASLVAMTFTLPARYLACYSTSELGV
jgi:hypothetical protein